MWCLASSAGLGRSKERTRYLTCGASNRVTGGGGAGMTAGRPMPTQDDVLEYFRTLSNWGRWGDDDELGTLNHITDDVRLAAARAVRHGRKYNGRSHSLVDAATGSRPAKSSVMKSSMICLRSCADSRASLFIRAISSVSVLRLATVRRTARVSRSARMCASNAATWASA